MKAPRSPADDVEHIGTALALASRILRGFAPRSVARRVKDGNDPVTAADLAVDAALRGWLPAAGEGWLSEESVDDASRLACRRVWVVDPLDGTRHFLRAEPEWCVSIALVEDGSAVAGGICNPLTRQTVLGSLATGVTLNGKPCTMRRPRGLEGIEVLASRSEFERGDWERFQTAPFTVRPVGSVAYKLALVASGLADATWTLVPKHEWDVAAGVALVRAAGGAVRLPDGTLPRFNQPEPRLPGMLAAPAGVIDAIERLLSAAPS